MKKITVKDLMVPLEEYATVSENATLYDAIAALEKAQINFDKAERQYTHRAVLVFNDINKIVGKLSQLDVLKALEPKYLDITEAGQPGRIATSGFSASFLKSMLENHSLLDKPIEEICKKAAGLKAKDCMHIPAIGEFVKETDSLSAAIHQLVMGYHQSLLVTDDENITGILRLTDVFREICKVIKDR